MFKLSQSEKTKLDLIVNAKVPKEIIDYLCGPSNYPKKLIRFIAILLRDEFLKNPDQDVNIFLDSLKDELVTIKDWYNGSIKSGNKLILTDYKTFDDMLQNAEDWHTELIKLKSSKIQKDKSDYKYPMGDPNFEPVRFKNGDYIIKLMPEDAKIEGDILSHCIGQYTDEIAEGSITAYSYRTPDGEPHVTIGFDVYEEMDEEKEQLYGDDYKVTNITLSQNYGKNDSRPAEQYRENISLWFNQLEKDFEKNRYVNLNISYNDWLAVTPADKLISKFNILFNSDDPNRYTEIANIYDNIPLENKKVINQKVFDSFNNIEEFNKYGPIFGDMIRDIKEFDQIIEDRKTGEIKYRDYPQEWIRFLYLIKDLYKGDAIAARAITVILNRRLGLERKYFKDTEEGNKMSEECLYSGNYNLSIDMVENLVENGEPKGIEKVLIFLNKYKISDDSNYGLFATAFRYIKDTDYLPQFFNNIDDINPQNNYFIVEIKRFFNELKDKDINLFMNLLNKLTPKTLNMLEAAGALPRIEERYKHVYLFIPENLSYIQKLLLEQQQTELAKNYLAAEKQKNVEESQEILNKIKNPQISDVPTEPEDEQEEVSSSIRYRLIKLSNKIDIFQPKISDKIDILLKL